MICNGRDIIRAGYEAGTKVAEIARQCESTPGSVKVIAHKMGLRHRFNLDTRVPPDKQDDWRNMTDRKKIPARRVAAYLGLAGAAL